MRAYLAAANWLLNLVQGFDSQQGSGGRRRLSYLGTMGAVEELLWTVLGAAAACESHSDVNVDDAANAVRYTVGLLATFLVILHSDVILDVGQARLVRCLVAVDPAFFKLVWKAVYGKPGECDESLAHFIIPPKSKKAKGATVLANWAYQRFKAQVGCFTWDVIPTTLCTRAPAGKNEKRIATMLRLWSSKNGKGHEGYRRNMKQHKHPVPIQDDGAPTQTHVVTEEEKQLLEKMWAVAAVGEEGKVEAVADVGEEGTVGPALAGVYQATDGNAAAALKDAASTMMLVAMSLCRLVCPQSCAHGLNLVTGGDLTTLGQALGGVRHEDTEAPIEATILRRLNKRVQLVVREICSCVAKVDMRSAVDLSYVAQDIDVNVAAIVALEEDPALTAWTRKIKAVTTGGEITDMEVAAVVLPVAAAGAT